MSHRSTPAVVFGPSPVASTAAESAAATARAAYAALDPMQEGDEEEAGSSQNTSGFPLEQRAIVSVPHVGPVLCVRYNATGEYVLTGGQDRTIQLWNLSKSKHIKEYSGPHGREVKDVQIAPSSDRFASCGGDRDIMLWDINTATNVRRLRGHDSAVHSLSYSSSDGSLLCSGGADMALKLWDLRAFSKDAVQSMSDARDSVTAVLMRETSIYAASMDGCVRRYDVRKASRTTDHIAAPVSSLSLSHDGNCLLLSCLDSTYRLLDVASGELLNEYAGAQSVQYRMEGAFDASDAHVVGGSEDGSIRLWDLVEAKLLQRYEGHTGAVSSLVCHPTKKQFVSAGVDGTVRLWQ